MPKACSSCRKHVTARGYCTRPQILTRVSIHTFAFYPQSEVFSEWSRGDSNPYPSPCNGAKGFPGASLYGRLRDLDNPKLGIEEG